MRIEETTETIRRVCLITTPSELRDLACGLENCHSNVPVIVAVHDGLIIYLCTEESKPESKLKGYNFAPERKTKDSER